jgi:hypothetical protein
MNIPDRGTARSMTSRVTEQRTDFAGWIQLICSYLWPHFFGAAALLRPRPPHFWGFEITFRHTTRCMTPLDEGSARRRDLYLTTYNTHKTQTSMPFGVFEPAIPASERLQTYTLQCAATGIVWFHIQILSITWKIVFLWELLVFTVGTLCEIRSFGLMTVMVFE